NGQIWKVDATTGKVIWKLGKEGNIALPAECSFTQAHAVHMNAAGSLMFFDNGVENRQSEVFAVKMAGLEQGHEASRSARDTGSPGHEVGGQGQKAGGLRQMEGKIDFHFKLPKEVFTDRMGSAYLIDDSTVLVCCSKRHITVLSNLKGVLLWTL